MVLSLAIPTHGLRPSAKRASTSASTLRFFSLLSAMSRIRARNRFGEHCSTPFRRPAYSSNLPPLEFNHSMVLQLGPAELWG